MVHPADTVIGEMEAAALYRRLTLRRVLALCAGTVALAACFALDVATGPAVLPLGEVVRTLLGQQADPAVVAIVWRIRLPVALMAVVVGAALAVSGVVMQTVMNNPLASSYTLGLSAAAGFGAALAVVAGSAIPLSAAVAVPGMAFVFALLACAAVLGFARWRGAGTETLVLAGIAVMFLFQALLSLLQFVASPEALAQIVFWLFGSLLNATWPRFWLVAIVLALLLPLLLRDGWQLTALRLGEDRARALGVRPWALRIRALAAVSVLTGIAVAFVGTIGFVGLVAPHLARSVLGEDQRFLIPGSVLAGGLLLSAASVASKTLVPGAIFPIGIVTALVGVPFLFWLIGSKRRVYWA